MTSPAELCIGVEAAAVDRVRADVVVVPLFAGERPLRAGAGRADWRLCGALSRLVTEGRLRGEPGEAALVAAFGGLRAPRLLLVGAGAREDFDAARCRALVADAAERGAGLRARRVAVALPDVRERRVGAFLAGAVQAMAADARPASLTLVLLVAPEEVARTTDLLRRARPGPIPDGLSLRLPATGGRTAKEAEERRTADAR